MAQRYGGKFSTQGDTSKDTGKTRGFVQAPAQVDPAGLRSNLMFLPPLALALTREVADREQRLVVFGDGDFLANTYLQNSGNQDLGVRIVEWITRETALVNVPSRTAEDNALGLEPWHEAVIGLTFLIGLPAAFALNGVFIWWRRRRA